MVLAFITTQMVQDMKEHGKMTCRMAKEGKFGRTAHFTKESLNLAKSIQTLLKFNQ